MDCYTKTGRAGEVAGVGVRRAVFKTAEV